MVGVGFLVTTLADGVTQSREAHEKALADSLFRARTGSITLRQQEALAEILNIRSESDSLRRLQLEALVRMDAVALTGEQLSKLQERIVRDLGAELTLSSIMSDRLEASAALSREIADSLRMAETRAAGRTQQTLASMQHRSNPLTSLSASFYVSFPRRDSLSARVLDALLVRTTAERRLQSTYPSTAPLLAGGEAIREVLPTHVFFYLWRGDDCKSSFTFNEVLVSAVRRLNYDSAEIQFESDSTTGFVRELQIEWDEAPFEIRTLQNVTVDDLAGACLLVELGPRYMTYPKLSTRWWAEADVIVPAIHFPQGRFANIRRSERGTGRDTHVMRLWENVPSLPTEMEMVDSRQRE